MENMERIKFYDLTIRHKDKKDIFGVATFRQVKDVIFMQEKLNFTWCIGKIEFEMFIDLKKYDCEIKVN